MNEGSIWFKRFVEECEKMSPHIKFVRVKYGFYRIYWTGGGEPAYIHEVYKEMPYKGYHMDDLDPRFESQRYYEEYEDAGEITRKIKNFVEGYWDSIATMRKRIYMLKNNKEFRETATKAYRQVRVK
jgi:hypothetical protein